MFRLSVILLVQLALLPKPMLLADAQGDYKSMFGKEDAQVSASSDRTAHVAFAGKLLKAAKGANYDPKFQALLCQKAYDFAIKHPTGYSTAIEAVNMLLTVAPDKKELWRERLTKVYRQQSVEGKGAERIEARQALLEMYISEAEESADSSHFEDAIESYRLASELAKGIVSPKVKIIEERIRQITAELQSAKKVESLLSRLKANAKDTAARTELILFCLGEQDAPAEAVKLLDSSVDEKLRTYVPLAAQGVTDLADAACLELAQWYTDIAPRLSDTGKATVLTKAKACCERYLEIHTTQDTSRLKAKLLLGQVEKDLNGLQALAKATSNAAVGRTIDLLKYVDLRKDVVFGNWELRDGSLISDNQDNVRIEFPYVPPEEYDIAIEFSTRSAMLQYLATPQLRFNVILGGYSGTTSGMEYVDNRGYHDNVTTVRQQLPGGRKRALVTVRRDGVTVYLNGKPFLRTQNRFSALPAGSFPGVRTNGVIGVGSFRDSVVFHSVRVREVSGQGRLLRESDGTSSTVAPLSKRPVFRLPPVLPELESKTPMGISKNIAPQAEAAGNTLALDLGNNVTMKLVLIPAGKFMMGSPDTEKDHQANESPQHEVTISKAFYMGMCEVTQEQYEAVMGSNPSEFKGIKNPVEQVSWNDAVEFCKKLSSKTSKAIRLPTEAEWEYACRGGTATRFSFGDDDGDLHKYGNYCDKSNANGLSYQDRNHDDGFDKTAPAGSFKPNAFGLYDMHGNVWEWCSDWYADSYPNANSHDPAGPDSGSQHVHRGGSWFDPIITGRSAFRRPGPADKSFANDGFRVVVESASDPRPVQAKPVQDVPLEQKPKEKPTLLPKDPGRKTIFD